MQPSTTATETFRVLWIDDDEHVRFCVRRLCKALAVDICTASSSQEALTEIADGVSYGPDLIVTDYELKAETGGDVLRCLRRGGVGAPAIVCSGSHSHREIPEDLGVIGSMGKPFRLHELRSWIQRARAHPRGIAVKQASKAG